MPKSKLIAALLVVLCGLCACKTTEKNMFDAYDKAIAGIQAKKDADTADYPYAYGHIRKEMKHETAVSNGDTFDLSTQWVRPTEGGGADYKQMHRYCVVVGQFKQRFNAVSMRERLTTRGYPESFVVETREPYYFVVANSYGELSPAVDLLHRVEADTLFRFKAPLPFILRPSQVK